MIIRTVKSLVQPLAYRLVRSGIFADVVLRANGALKLDLNFAGSSDPLSLFLDFVGSPDPITLDLDFTSGTYAVGATGAGPRFLSGNAPTPSFNIEG